MKIQSAQKNFTHICSKCEFLGSYVDYEGNLFDIYLHHFNVIFRYGNDEEAQRNVPLGFLNEYIHVRYVYEVGFSRALSYMVSRN